MNKPKVYVHRLGSWYDLYMDDKNEALLRSFADVVSEGGRDEPMGEDELCERMGGARAILSLNGIGADEITPAVLKRVGTVELICISHWWEQFTATAAEAGVLLIEGSNGNTAAVSEWTLACALMGVRKIMKFNDALKAGSPWAEPRNTVGMLSETTIGLIGLGRVGKYVARAMKALGVSVIAFDKEMGDEEAASMGIRLCPLNELLEASDIVSIHLPVLPSTRGMLGAEHFARIRDGAVFINSARSAVYDEGALITELKKGRFEAYIDVFDIEPIPADHPFRSMQNVVITPHIAGTNAAMGLRCGREAIESLRDYFDGKGAIDKKFMFP